MPHAGIEWPLEIKHAMRKHVEDAIRRLQPERYEQEHAYVAALIARLDGVVYDGPAGRVELIGTVVTDRGPNSAEKQWGADFAITAALKRGRRTTRKAVLGQAKRGAVEDLPISERLRLDNQCRQMRRATRSCIVLETPLRETSMPSSPSIHILNEEPSYLMGLGGYIVDHLMPCLHGDKRSDFVFSVATSRLSSLHVSVQDR